MRKSRQRVAGGRFLRFVPDLYSQIRRTKVQKCRQAHRLTEIRVERAETASFCHFPLISVQTGWIASHISVPSIQMTIPPKVSMKRPRHAFST